MAIPALETVARRRIAVKPTEYPKQITALLSRGETEELLHNALGAIYVFLNHPASYKTRVTLFLPDFSTYCLWQAGRYDNASNRISDTFFRMGVGCVGAAFTSRTPYRINYHEPGGFLTQTRQLNLEDSEAMRHHDIDRMSFLSIPILDPNAPDARERRLGVLSIDAMPPDAIAEVVVRDLAPIMPNLIKIIRTLGLPNLREPIPMHP